MAKTCGVCEKSTEVGRMEENGHTVKRWCRCSVTGKEHADYHQCDVPEKPRLCEVLGVDVGERFRVLLGDEKQEAYGPYFISGNGRFNDRGSFDPEDAIAALIEAINHPEKIEWIPRLTPDEVQRCRDFGAEWVSMDKDGYQVWLWEDRPELKPNGVWDGGTSCAQAWARFFPSVQPGRLVRVEDEP